MQAGADCLYRSTRISDVVLVTIIMVKTLKVWVRLLVLKLPNNKNKVSVFISTINWYRFFKCFVFGFGVEKSAVDY